MKIMTIIAAMMVSTIAFAGHHETKPAAATPAVPAATTKVEAVTKAVDAKVKAVDAKVKEVATPAKDSVKK